MVKLNHNDLEFKKEPALKGLSVLSKSYFHRMFSTSISLICVPSISSFISVIFHSFGNNVSHNDFNDSRRFKIILWSIICGTRGGPNRAKILNLIKDTPMNANKIATVLGLDHKTVVHHVKILSKNELVSKAEKDYGAEYQLTQIMKENQTVLEEIMQKIGTK
ncbi:ArsR/SmtB family transcription factor [Nitrosopumilus ureiphilus]|nr:winged helix-turn-helix domain-containing protein [Nitrosopumilus ureiphilus]